MKSRKLITALGLAALLLMTLGVAGCNSVESESPINGQSANPMEDINNPDGMEMIGSVSGLPDEPPAASGTINKISSNTLDLKETVPVGETAKIWQVIFSSGTKVLRPVFHVGEGEPAPPEELTIYELEEGQSVDVYGEIQGERIFAHTIVVWTGGKLK